MKRLHKKIMFAVLTMAIFGLVLHSCTKESEVLEITTEQVLSETQEIQKLYTVADIPQLEVIDGMLYFDNEEEYFKTLEVLPNLTEKELEIWEESIGFKSLRRFQEEIMAEIDEAEPVYEDYINVLKKYSDYLYISDDNAIRFYITDFCYSSISNIDNIYLIDNIFNLISENLIFSSKNIEEVKNKTCSSFQYENVMSNSKCSLQGVYTYGDRRVMNTLSLYYQYNSSLGAYLWFMKVYVWGEKKNTWGNWKSYKTTLRFEKTYANVNVPQETMYWNNTYWAYKWVDTPKDVLEWSGNSNGDVSNLTSYKYIESQIKYKAANYIKYHCEAASRGTNNNFAIINCGY